MPSAATFTGGSTSAAKYSTINYTAGSFTITKAVLTVTPTAQNIVYGASAAITFGVTGFSGSESAANAAGYVAPTCVVNSYSVTSSAASTHTITCSGGSSTNYTFVTTATAVATVIKATLSVTPDAKSVTYGDGAPTLTFNVNGWKNAQSAANAAGYVAPTCSSAYTTTSPAGTPVSITCSGGSATNYDFNTSATASITIAKLGTLTITAASPAAIAYGGATAANSFSASGKAAADVISGVTYSYAGTGSTTYAASATAPVLPGTYSITPSAATFSTGSTANYTTISYVAGVLRITGANLVITVSSQSVVYGSSITETFTVANLNSGDAVTVSTFTYTGSGATIYGPSTTAPTSVGSYSLTPSGASFANSAILARYANIGFVAGSVSILKAPLQLVPASVSVVYGAALPALAFAVTGLQFSQSIPSIAGYVAPTCTSTYTTTTQVAASPVAVTCSGGSAANYSFVSGSANVVTITKRPLTITGTSLASRAFNGTTSPGAITLGLVTGYASGETLPIAATASAYSAATAGTYSSTITYALDNNVDSTKGLANNYSVTSSSVNGIVTPAVSGFTVGLSQGSTNVRAVNYGSSETITVTATTSTPGTVNFKVSISGGTATDITGCSTVTVTNGAAICLWVNPSIGRARLTITLAATDAANVAVDPQFIDALIVARPTIVSFQVRSQAGVTTGAAGTVVIITGTNFTGITSIRFNGVEAEKTFRATSTQATVTVPLGATTGPITIVTQLGGSVTSSTNFTVVAPG